MPVRIGLIGSGNIARALVRGWGEPVLLTDSGSGRAATLAAEVGGERMASNAELADQADLVVLAHKPYQLDQVAEESGRSAKAIVSTLAGTTTAQVAEAWRGVPVVRVIPNTASELREGASIVAEAPDADAALLDTATELFERLGLVMRIEERLLGAATSIAGVGPAYLALVAEAWVDAAVRHGLKPAQAQALVTQTMAGTAALLRAARRRHARRAPRRDVAGRRHRQGPRRPRARRPAGRLRRRDRRGDGPVSTILVLATAREEIGGFIRTLAFVYSLIIIAYILSSLFFNFGGRMPYNRWASAALGFLRDVTEPYLAIFRRFIPPLGPLDLSPIVALIVLQVVAGHRRQRHRGMSPWARAGLVAGLVLFLDQLTQAPRAVRRSRAATRTRSSPASRSCTCATRASPSAPSAAARRSSS